MRLNTFEGATMAEAMAEVRKVFGDDAIIVQCRNLRNGRIAIQAAIEDAEDVDAQLAAALDAEPAAPNFSTDAAADAKADYDDVRDAATERSLLERLAFHGLPEAPGRRLLKRAAAGATGATGVNNGIAAALHTALAEQYDFKPLPVCPRKPVMLVGPPGVGKTVTTAKLAARAVLGGFESHVATADVVRAGAVEQLEAYTRLLKIPLYTLEDRRQLRMLLQAQRQALFIDSPGVNPFDDADIAALKAIIEPKAVDLVLVLAAGMDPEECADLALTFAKLGCRRLLVTRLDTARRFGGMIAAADAGRLAFSDVGHSPAIADGLLPLDAPSFAHLLTEDPDQALVGLQAGEKVA